MAPPARASSQAGTVRLAGSGPLCGGSIGASAQSSQGPGELASLVADAEREPASPATPAQGPRVLRVEVNGLLHDWFDVDEMGDFVRSAAFAGTLRENVARYFGVPLEKQAIYDEDGLLTTSADFSRALQRVSPKLYVYDVLQMGQELRERTVEELEAIDAEVEQSWRHFGAYNSRSRQASSSMLGGPTMLSEKTVELGDRCDKVPPSGPCLEVSCAEGDRGGTSGTCWQPAPTPEQQVQPQPLNASAPGAGTSLAFGAASPAVPPLPAAQQRRPGAVVSHTPPPPLGPELRGRGTADFGNTTPIAEYLKEASAAPDEHQAFSLFAPASTHGTRGPATPNEPATATASAAQLRGGVRVLSAGPPVQPKGTHAHLHDMSATTDATNAALLNSSGSSRTLPGGEVSPAPPPPSSQQAGAMRFLAGTIGNPASCLRAAHAVPEAWRPEGATLDSANIMLAGAPQRHASTPVPATASRPASRERVGAAASAGQSLHVLRRAPSQCAVETAVRSPRTAVASPPRTSGTATPPPPPPLGTAADRLRTVNQAGTPIGTVTTPRLATAGSRRRSTTPVPVVVSPVWGGRGVQATTPQWPSAAQGWPMASQGAPSRTATPRRSVTPTRREAPGAQCLGVGGPAPLSLTPTTTTTTVRTITPGRLTAWRGQPSAVPNTGMSLCEWSQVYQH